MEQQNLLLYNSYIYNIPRKCNLLPIVPYNCKGTNHILKNGIHTSCTTEVISLLWEISYGLMILSHDFTGG